MSTRRRSRSTRHVTELGFGGVSLRNHATSDADARAAFDHQQAPAELLRRANALAGPCERRGVTLPELEELAAAPPRR
jgi:hypothetical protein